MSRTADLLPLLSALGPQAVSGERLAQRLRITRTAVWKQVHGLEKMGFPLRRIKRQGYALAGTPDVSLACLKFKGALQHWAKPHYELSTPSTQRLAIQAAQGGIPEGHFWLAEVQTAGRGRLERRWSSGFGGIWFSLVLRPQVPPSRAASIGLVAALAWARTIENKTGIKARLKWPNDIVVKDPAGSLKKMGGLLTQMSGEVDKTDWIVLGMGINVYNQIPHELTATATSLAARQERLPRLPRSELLAAFLQGFYADYRQWQRRGFAAFQAAYWAHYARPSEQCILKTATGTLRGIAKNVTAAGALLVQTGAKTHTILEGEITL